MMTTTTQRLVESSIAALDERIAEVQHSIEHHTALLDDMVNRRTQLREQRRHLAIDLEHAHATE